MLDDGQPVDPRTARRAELQKDIEFFTQILADYGLTPGGNYDDLINASGVETLQNSPDKDQRADAIVQAGITQCALKGLRAANAGKAAISRWDVSFEISCNRTIAECRTHIEIWRDSRVRKTINREKGQIRPGEKKSATSGVKSRFSTVFRTTKENNPGRDDTWLGDEIHRRWSYFMKGFKKKPARGTIKNWITALNKANADM